MVTNELKKAIKKRALGFTSVEETVEYELIKAKKYLFCKRFNRLYFSGGFINISATKHIKPIKKFVGVNLNSDNFCVKG